MSVPQEPDRIAEGVLLSAVKRAEHHKRGEGEGVLLATIVEHLGLRHYSWTTRRVRPQLEALIDAGLLARFRRHGLVLWKLTPAGRRRASPYSALPESPQHQRWREARTLAEQENERAWTALLDAVEAAEDLLNRPLSASPPSAAWLSIGERVRGASRLLASVTYCLREWQEPQDARADVVPVGEAELRSTGGWDRLAPAVRHGTLEAEND